MRTTNTVERSFLEEQRRAKVIPKFRTEKECLKLVFATLWRASERWRGVRFTNIEQKQLERYQQKKAVGRAGALSRRRPPWRSSGRFYRRFGT